jgi:outer membrane lipoprotein-sorting protein
MSITKQGLLSLIAMLMVTTAVQAKKIASGEDVLEAMQKAYANKWYKTTTFTQITTQIAKDGTSKASTWYEAIAMPARLRIDFDPLSSKDGILFARDNIYLFKNGLLNKSQPLVHPLLLLGFDVYFIPVSESIAKLRGLNVDLSLVREDKWQGRPVYVVGAKAGDNHSPQFWIDKQRLYFVRMLRPTGKDGAQTEEIQFNKYQKLAGGWVAPEVIFMTDGRITTTETYSDIKANMTLDDALFDPEQWASVKHWLG